VKKQCDDPHLAKLDVACSKTPSLLADAVRAVLDAGDCQIDSASASVRNARSAPPSGRRYSTSWRMSYMFTFLSSRYPTRSCSTRSSADVAPPSAGVAHDFIIAPALSGKVWFHAALGFASISPVKPKSTPLRWTYVIVDYGWRPSLPSEPEY
jgi:hypothetical protein